MKRAKLYEFCCYNDFWDPYIEEDDMHVLIMDNASNFREIRKKALEVSEKEITKWIRTWDLNDING